MSPQQKLELVVGVAAPWMELELRAAGGELLARLEPDDALLGAFPVSDGCGLHVGPQLSPMCPHCVPNCPHCVPNVSQS